MCVDCVLASPRIAQVDPSDEPLPEVVQHTLEFWFHFITLEIFLGFEHFGFVKIIMLHPTW
jgi:hypothetical protein